MAGGAFDNRRIAANHNPLIPGTHANVRISPEEVAKALAEALANFTQTIRDMILPLLSEITGIDFTSWSTMLNQVFFDNLDNILQSLTGIDVVSLVSLIRTLAQLFNPINLFNNGTFTPPDLVTMVLGPTGLIAMLTSGLLDAINIPGLDASKIVSGLLSSGRLQSLIDAISQGHGGGTGLGFSGLQSLIAALPGAQGAIDAICNALGVSGTGHSLTDLGNALLAIPGANIVSIAASIVTGILTAANIPGLDASKIITGLFGAAQLQDLIDSVSQGHGGSTGLGFSGLQSLISGLLNPQDVLDKIVNALGVSGTGHTLSDLLSALQAIPGVNLVSVAASLITGVLTGTNIPSLDASKITTGTFSSGLIPALAISAITSLSSYLTNINSSGVWTGALTSAATVGGTAITTLLGNITSGGLFDSGKLSNVTGTIAAALISALDASKITTGTFSTGLIPALAISAITNLSNYLTNIDSSGVWTGALTSVATVGGTAITTLLGNITAAGLFDSGKLSNVTGTIAAALISALDASKITTGTFATGLIPALALSGITGLTGYLTNLTSGGVWSGSLTSAATVGGTAITTLLTNITSGGLFDSGKLSNVTGTIAAALISALDASKITTGTFASGLIPALAISGITSLSGYLTNLTSSGVWSGALTSAATVGGNAITTLLGNITAAGLFDSGKLSNVTGTIAAALISALDASKITTGTFTDGFLPGLGSLRDAISQAVAGGATTGYTAANVKAFLQAFPNTNVVGVLGPTHIGDTAQAIIDFATQALNGDTTTGNSLGVFGSLLALLSNTAHTGASTAQAASISLTNRAIYNPLGHAIDPTARATFDIAAMITTGSLPTFNITAAAPAIGFIGFPDAGTKKSVWWYAPSVPGATISALTVNVYSLNTSTGAVSFLCTSGNIVGSAIVGWNNYAIATLDWIDVAQGDILAVEMVIRSTSASYAIAGLTSPITAHPTSIPPSIGATRSIPANVTTAVTGVSVPSNVAGAVVRLVGGGGGGSGSGINGANSGPGGGGAGMVDVTVPAASLGATYTTTIGGAGGGGASSGNGSAGGASTFTSSSTSLSAGGGAAGNRTGSVGGAGGTNSISGSGLTTNTNATGGAGANGSASGSGNNGSNGSGTGSAAGGGSGGAGTGTTSGGSGGSAQPSGGAGGTGSTGTGGTGQIMTTLVGSGGAGGGGGLNTVGNAGAGGTGGTYGGGGGGAGSKSGATGGVGGGAGGTGGVLVQWIAGTSSFTPTSSTNIPWMAISGSEGVAQIPQATSMFNTSGAHTYNIPAAFQYAGAMFDVIVLGGGAGGSTPAQSLGGTGGNFTVISNLVYGTDIPLGTTSFSVSVGAGGAGVISGARNNGGSTTVTIPTYGTITATGGSSATGANAGGNTSPTSELVNGTLYQGGLGGSTSFEDGHSPGGGGGGNAGVGGAAGSGATGAAWVTAHQ